MAAKKSDAVVYLGTGRRKNAIARVRLVPGKGEFIINKKPALEYLGRQALVNYALLPLKVTDNLDHYDVLVNADGGGISGQSGAIRLGVARALLEVSLDYRPELKRAGFLRRDPRMVERKKYGLKKARKRPQFSKR